MVSWQFHLRPQEGIQSHSKIIQWKSVGSRSISAESSYHSHHPTWAGHLPHTEPELQNASEPVWGALRSLQNPAVDEAARTCPVSATISSPELPCASEPETIWAGSNRFGLKDEARLHRNADQPGSDRVAAGFVEMEIGDGVAAVAVAVEVEAKGAVGWRWVWGWVGSGLACGHGSCCGVKKWQSRRKKKKKEKGLCYWRWVWNWWRGFSRRCG